jgi:hypothetical protein
MNAFFNQMIKNFNLIGIQRKVFRSEHNRQ